VLSAAATPFISSAIRDHFSKEHPMNPIIAAFDRTSRSLRRTARSLTSRVTRKASLKLVLTISLPPFVKLAIDYKVDLSKPENRLPKPANDNRPRRSRNHTA
jgi:hypothetical protein